jgi:ABC-type Zn uptake system ZnuABC Zn-binding protein ZnuA
MHAAGTRKDYSVLGLQVKALESLTCSKASLQLIQSIKMLVVEVNLFKVISSGCWSIRVLVSAVLVGVVVLTGCSASADGDGQTPNALDQGAEFSLASGPATRAVDFGQGNGLQPLLLPSLQALQLEGRKLNVVATTSVIGDVVSRIGGPVIDLTVLMKPGQDPHSYEPSAGDLTTAARADVIFVNGWDLEEGLIQRLQSIAEGVPQIPVSANIQPLRIGSQTEPAVAGTLSDAARIDPHTWMDPHNGVQWAVNVREVLSALDPANAEHYQRNFTVFEGELQQLISDFDRLVATLPLERRRLVTNHDALGYFARAYRFKLVGTILPGGATLAEPSAKELADLVAAMESEDVCVVFAETSSRQDLAQVLAKEVQGCPQVRVETLYTGALGTPGSGADSYIGMMRFNIETIVESLRRQ